MRARQLVEGLLAILGIWYLVDAVVQLPFLAGLFLAFGEHAVTTTRPAFDYLAISAALKLVIGSCLLVARARLATKLTPSDVGNGDIAPLSWLAPAFAVVGLYFAVRGATGVLGGVVSYRGMSFEMAGLSIGHFAELCIGTVLFFGASALSLFWQRLRRTGVEERAG
jgi:hypothetical protein